MVKVVSIVHGPFGSTYSISIKNRLIITNTINKNSIFIIFLKIFSKFIYPPLILYFNNTDYFEIVKLGHTHHGQPKLFDCYRMFPRVDSVEHIYSFITALPSNLEQSKLVRVGKNLFNFSSSLLV